MKSLRHILALLIAAGITAAGLLASVSFWGTQRSESSVERALIAKDVTADILPPPMYLIELRLVLSQALEETMPVTLARAEAQRLEQEYSARVSYWREHPPYGLETALLGPQHRAAEQFFEAARGVLDTIAAGDRAGAQDALQTAHAIYLDHRAGVDDTVKLSTAFATEATTLFQDTGRRVMIVQWIVLLMSGTLLVAFGIWARRAVWAMTGGEPADAAAIANAVAHGNLSVRVHVAPGDDTSVMAALKRMCHNLSGLVDTVRRSSDTIASGSHQIAADNIDLSKRTDHQATGLQQTAASMEQFSSTVKNNAESAREAELLAHQARTAAVRGGSVVDQVVASMEGITSSTRQVSDIVGVIDDIAFQTNILALNAAVEAARAGEQGRSFAVVASEVQTLARRSADAAKTIKTLIGSSVEQIQLGSKLAADAGANMAEIVGQANQVARLVSKISAATSEQTAGIGQVSTAVAQLDLTTQQNAALVQQSASAAESLNKLAAQLVAAVSAFKLDQRQTANTAA